MENYPDITALFGPVFALAVIVEYTAIRLNYARGKYELRDAFASMSMGVGNLIVGALTAFALTWLMMSLWPYRIMTISSNAYSFILVFIAYDFVYYWKHRLAHRV
ncbi:MAG: sterol desaturase family protein, partial [Henriciella sp.]